MARPSLWTHRKFIMLARLLGAPYKAAGVLEMVWRQGHECGDPIVGSGADVEFAVGWDGESGVCSDALVASGFLDRDESGSLHIHDMEDHEPEYVKARRRKEQQRRRARQSHPCPVTVTTLSRDCPPTPAPAPVSQKTSAAPVGDGAGFFLTPQKAKRLPKEDGPDTPQARVVQAYVNAVKEDMPEFAAGDEKKHYINMARLLKTGMSEERATKYAIEFARNPPMEWKDKNMTGIDYLVSGIKRMQERERNSR